MADPQLIALYELKRQSFLTGFIANPDRFAPALAYAYEKRLPPIFNEEIQREHHKVDPFETAYTITPEFAKGVIKYIAEHWNDRDFDGLQFNKIEDKFGGYKTHRMELTFLIRYARLSGLFDDEVYAAVAKMAPVESQDYTPEFTPEDVYFD